MTALIVPWGMAPPRAARNCMIPDLFPARRLATREELRQSYRLRFEVFCEELRFWTAPAAGQESDEFDCHALHFGAYERGEMVGTLRLVLRRPFPLERYCTLDAQAPDLGKIAVAEISRLAIAARYRQRRPAPGDGSLAGRRMQLVFSLYKAMLHESKKLGLDYWVCAMERTLLRRLAGMGCDFRPIGPEVDCGGPVRPYLLSIAQAERDQVMFT